MVGIDGVPFFKQKNTAMFLIVGMNANFPPSERSNIKNMFLLGMWVGQHQSNMNMYLEPLLSQFKSLSKSINILYILNF